MPPGKLAVLRTVLAATNHAVDDLALNALADRPVAFTGVGCGRESETSADGGDGESCDENDFLDHT